MNRYRLSRQAEQDLEDIWTYLAQQDQLAADKQIAHILNRFPMLAQFPDMGKKRDELMKEYFFAIQNHKSLHPKLIDATGTTRSLTIVRKYY
ncbi:MAG: type II toxin-antitoxin system RelE/ParE family toxin [Aulosira sp. DedQUE10]|nr:type II toxin-antitoxin system RelE/ParE family toxin [Aulosira sp. DedQUE10]